MKIIMNGGVSIKYEIGVALNFLSVVALFNTFPCHFEKE